MDREDPGGGGRARERRRRTLVLAGCLVALYYFTFSFAGVYSPGSVAVGGALSLGLILSGLALPRASERGASLIPWAVAVLLAVGGLLSAWLSGRSHCIGFHVIWALPLVFVLLFPAARGAGIFTSVASLLGGIGILVADGEGATRVIQWGSIGLAAGLFALARASDALAETAELLAERRLAQARLALHDRLASVGLLAAGVAHEINNPLACVRSGLASLELPWPTRPGAGELAGLAERQEALLDAQEAVERIRAIVASLLQLAHAGDGSLGPVDVNLVAERTLRLVRHELEGSARITWEPGLVPPARADAARLGQVVLNLLVNAGHAVAAEGSRSGRIALRTYPRGPERVVIEVEDSGTGMDAATQARLFEPFFTTKPAGEGTGLGLHVSREIVEGCGGRIEVESAPGSGSTFRVVLLAAAVSAPAPPVRQPVA